MLYGNDTGTKQLLNLVFRVVLDLFGRRLVRMQVEVKLLRDDRADQTDKMAGNAVVTCRLSVCQKLSVVQR